MKHYTYVRCCALAGLALTFLISVSMRSQAAEAAAVRITPAERKGLNSMVARILEKDFKLVPIRSAAGGWRVGLAVRNYTKTETEKGVRVEPYWSTNWAEGIQSWNDLRISVELANGFCGGQGRSFVVTILSKRDTAPIKVYAVFAGESLARLDYMDSATCME